MRIGYGKLGRSMPLTLDKCGNLGGDVEMAAVVGRLARRYPQHTFVLLGRNSGERPQDVGLPSNVENPWTEWGPELRGRLARANPDRSALTVERHIQVREIFRDLTEKAFIEADGHVFWVGQHGTTNSPIPTVKDRSVLTKPQDWCAFYASFILNGINAWREARNALVYEEVYLNADARNNHKMRDLKWPLLNPVLAQYNFTNNIKHERYGDATAYRDYVDIRKILDDPANADKVWTSTIDNVYSRLEVNGLYPGTPFGSLIRFNDDWNRPGHFGLFINEAGRYGKPDVRRVNVVEDWVLPLDPYFMCGTWTDESKKKLGRDITPAPWDQYYPNLHSVRTTLTTPSSGSGWATAKPWEAFAGGTVCFFHPKYDTQNNILSDAPQELQEWLRVKTPDELALRVKHLNSQAGRNDWLHLVTRQRQHFVRALGDQQYMNMIDKRIGLSA